MYKRRVLLVKIVIIFFEQSLAAPVCDMEVGILLDEGNMGQSEDFNWLGILKVFLHDGDVEQVAVTGIVLVKPRHALVSADDVVRIPKNLFETATQAMFISEGDIPVYYNPMSYITHPEFKTTFNTIAIIELNIGRDSPLIPICFPTASFDSNHLYLTTFTDDNKILEKIIYKIEYTEKHECDAFYDKEGLRAKNRDPTAYLCGKRHNTSKNCVWDNGMTLVSNTSGWFTLVGFSIHGPGCAAPARFINMPQYFSWINLVTRYKDDYYDYEHRRAHDLDNNIPIHSTYTQVGSLGKTLRQGTGSGYEYVPWPFYKDQPKYFTHFAVHPKQDLGVVEIYPFYNMLELKNESCSNDRSVMYKENFKLAAPTFEGSVEYRLSLYDMVKYPCTCVILTVDCPSRSQAYLAFKEVFVYDAEAEESGNVKEVTSPPDVFLRFPNPETDYGLPFKPISISIDGPPKKKIPNYVLYIQFEFKKSAILKFEMSAQPQQATLRENPTNNDGLRAFKVDRIPKRKKMRYWDLSRDVVDKTVKEPALEAEREVVQQTVSAGGKETTPIVVVLWCLLVSACSRRAFIVQ